MEPTLLAVLAVAVLAFSAISRRAERSIVSAPMFFVAAGFAVGNGGLGWLDFGKDDAFLHGLAELTLILVLFTDAARIDLSCLRRERNLPSRMLALGLPLTIAAGAIAAALIFPGFGLWEAVLLAAILAPTDAALGLAVVNNPLIPARIRQTLNVESGLNDGIALPAVLLFAALAGTGEQEDFGRWAQFVGLQLLLGPLVGAAVGFGGGRLINRAMRAGWMNDAFQRLSGLGLAVLAFAGAELVGGNGFIAAFVAGLTLGNVARQVCACLFEFGEAEGQLLTLLVLFLFGGMMVPTALEDAGVPTLIYALLSLTVIRMVPVALSLMGTGLRPASVVFLAWFGPRGLASILFALIIVEDSKLASGVTIEAIVVVTVLLSIFLHGATAYPLARRYGDYIQAAPQRAEAEHEPVMELPVRARHASEPKQN